MKLRTWLWGTFWTLIALALVFHVAAGWYFSDVLIEDGFVPDPNPYLVSSGDFELEEVQYDTPLGPMDAWYLPADGDTWVIHVHGRTVTPAEAEILFAPLQDAGYPQLSIAYRNDDQQPLDPSGYYQFGATEWEDVDGALAYALENGAEDIVFSGFSTGAGHIMSFMFNKSLDAVSGVLMDSPNIDFGTTVDYRAEQRDLPIVGLPVPPTVSWVAKFFTSLRIDVNWKSLDYVDKADLIIKQPVLIHHGTEDESVPLSISLELAEAKPDMVRLVQVEGAGHVDSYEADPEKYAEEVLSFLSRVG